MNKRIVEALLALYPAAWRKEYGPEFRDLLAVLQFRLGTLANVIWHGAMQRGRSMEPWMLLGLPLAFLWTIFYLVLILAPPPYDRLLAFSVPPPFPVLPVLLVTLVLYLWLIIGCGCWTVRHRGGTIPHAGIQTIKLALLAYAPHLVVYALVITGTIGVNIIGPGDAQTTIAERGIAIVIYTADSTAPNLPPILLLMIVELSICWVGGAIGGWLGREVKYESSPAT